MLRPLKVAAALHARLRIHGRARCRDLHPPATTREPDEKG